MDGRIPDLTKFSWLSVWSYTGGEFSRILKDFQIFAQNSDNFQSFST
jgi:hypothetical protein